MGRHRRMAKWRVLLYPNATEAGAEILVPRLLRTERLIMASIIGRPPAQGAGDDVELEAAITLLVLARKLRLVAVELDESLSRCVTAVSEGQNAITVLESEKKIVWTRTPFLPTIDAFEQIGYETAWSKGLAKQFMTLDQFAAAFVERSREDLLKWWAIGAPT